eukprot:gene6840-8484_t
MLYTNEEIILGKNRKPDNEKSREELIEELKEMREVAKLNRTGRIMIDEMYQFVALLDPQGNLLDVNEPALQGGGMIRHQIQGIPFWDCRWWAVSEETKTNVRDAVGKASKGEFVRYEVDIFGKSAGTELITIDFSLMPLFNENGEVWLILPEGRNITEKRAGEIEIARKNNELRALYEKIKELDELKTQFFANVSHELRTPLALIVGPTEKLLKDPEINDNKKKDLDIIARNARGLLKHVNSLLDISRLEAGQMNINYSMVDIGRSVNYIASCFEILAREKNLDYSIITPPENQPLLAAIDSDKIQRTITNLISNAFKFTPSGGSVKCMVEKVMMPPGNLPGFRIVVSDTGPGVPEHLQEIIFERFRQVDGTSTRKHGGTGLGLSIVKEFVQLHGGTVKVSNVGSNGGAQFVVTIPLSPNIDELSIKKTISDQNVSNHLNKENNNNQPQQSQQQQNNQQQQQQQQQQNIIIDSPKINGNSEIIKDSMGSIFSAQQIAMQAVEELAMKELYTNHDTPVGNKPVVLVVEDNIEMNRFIAELLSKHYQVYTAVDGVEGLEKTKSLLPDIIVTDCMMPRMSGDEMVAEIRSIQELDSIPILLLTAKADDNLRVKLLTNGVSDYVNKPFSSEELVARVINLITMKKAKQLLQEELKSACTDLNELISQLANKKRDLQTLVTELEKERSLLDRANRSKDEFLMNLSHELRTPLNGILGWSQVLRIEADPNELNLGLESIERCARAQNQLINDLLDMSLIIGGKLNISSELVNLPQIIQNAIEALIFQAQSKKIQLETEFGFDGYVKGDPTRLQQVIWNLVANSIKFTNEGGQIKIQISKSDGSNVKGYCSIAGGGSSPCRTNGSSSSDNQWVLITITDNGKGIPSEFIPNVFERFQQADCSSTRIHGGLGLGLSIVNNIVQLHGGRVYVYSEGVNKGSQFSVLLPSIDTNSSHVFENSSTTTTTTTTTTSTTTSTKRSRSISLTDSTNYHHHNNGSLESRLNIDTSNSIVNRSTPETLDGTKSNNHHHGIPLSKPLQGLSIMIVDDLEETLQLFSKMLLKLGATNVNSFTTVSEAFEFLSSSDKKPDLILSDLTLPREDGYSFIKRIRDKEHSNPKLGHIPVIALTAAVSSSDKTKVLNSGFDMHLSKPVNLTELNQSIQYLLSNQNNNNNINNNNNHFEHLETSRPTKIQKT